MNNFYQYLTESGINETAASWGCVIVLAIVVIGTVGVICRLIPRRK